MSDPSEAALRSFRRAKQMGFLPADGPEPVYKPILRSAPTEATFDKLLASIFKTSPEQGFTMRAGTSEGWIEMSADKPAVFLHDGSDASRAARQWFKDRGY